MSRLALLLASNLLLVPSVSRPPDPSVDAVFDSLALGVDTQLAIYTDEGHDIQQAEHQRDIVRRAVVWLDKYSKNGGEK
jgi:dipeptidyl aminopeptidase/acylaminoacyl peptidase